MCEPMECDSKAVCVCLLEEHLQEMFPSYTAGVNYELSKHVSSHCALPIDYLMLSSTQLFLKFV